MTPTLRDRGVVSRSLKCSQPSPAANGSRGSHLVFLRLSCGHPPMGHKPILTQTSLPLHGKLKPRFEFCKQQQGQSQIKGYPTSRSSRTVCMLCNFLKATQTTATKLLVPRHLRVLEGSSHPRWGVGKAAGRCPGCCSRFRSARLDPDNTWMRCQHKIQKRSLPRLLELQKITTYLHSYTWLWLCRFACHWFKNKTPTKLSRSGQWALAVWD